MRESFNKLVKYNQGIAKINIEGLITSIKSLSLLVHGAPFHPDEIIKEIDLAERDDRIKALIISINSPGGYFVSCYEISDRISLCKKPNVALIREIATSGGYLAISSAQTIIANEMSHVGSIGVSMPRFEYVEVMKKIGIEYKTIKAGKYKDIGIPFRTLSTDEEEKLQNLADKIYSKFIEIIAKRRNLPEEKVKELADGFILLGREAKEVGLVDKIGNLQTAIAFCEEKGNFKHDKIVEKRESLVERISGIFGRLSYNIGFGIVDGIVQKGCDLRIQ